jgi:Dolichyl-phosphate-mannose-protein mannosyltransferase
MDIAACFHLKRNIVILDRVAHSNSRSLLLLAIPLVLSAYTHLWNPTGFPVYHIDEGHYLRKAMYVLDENGLQEGPEDVLSHYGRIYTHPYFSQIFLAGIFAMIGYPDSLNPTPGDAHSIEMLWFVPRVLMGLLAVVDTFLIYKIAERRYNMTVALIASILFAVMPISWITRMVLLDSILLPFLLSSILFAVYLKDSKYQENNKKKIAIVLLSGIFIGLAIFTKVPAFTAIPLVGVLIYTNSSSHKLRTLGLWFAPVILIPLIWPAYSLASGQLDEWFNGVLWQAGRGGQFSQVFRATDYLFKFDPVFMSLGFAGLFFAAVKRDFFPLLWAIPFMIFMYLIGYVSYWFMIPLLMPLCIAAASMIQDLSSRISKKKLIHQTLPFVIISVIGIFGIITTSMLITMNVNSTYLATQAFLTENLPAVSGADELSDNRVYIIGRPTYIWILKYVFDEGNNDYQSYYNKGKIYRSISEGNADKFVFIVDGKFRTDLRKSTTKENIKAIQEIYDNSTTLAKINVKNTNKLDSDQYPYSTNTKSAGKGGGRVEIRASNYTTDGSNNDTTTSRDEALKHGITGDILTDIKSTR